LPRALTIALDKEFFRKKKEKKGSLPRAMVKALDKEFSRKNKKKETLPKASLGALGKEITQIKI